MNNRNCRPSLRLVDGGQPSPWSLRGIAKALTPTPETVTEKFARQDAERAAKAAPASTVPVAAPAPGAGISGYVGNTALQAREKAAGLRDGGEVPGSGQGDKIPALYEPGEFVVSNAMLKKAPGLRDQLHELREETLAGQGKTVAQADAQAYDDGSEGEQDERVPERSEKRVGGTGAGARMADHDDQGGGAGGGRRLRDLGQITLRANQGFGFSEDFLKSASDAIGERFNPTPPPNGRYGAPPNPPLNSAAQPAPTAAPEPSAPRPSLRAGLGNQAGVVNKALYAGGRTLSGAARLAGSLGPAALGADAISHFNDYKINDPGVDSSNSGTFKALANGDFSGAGRSFSKGALEAGMDLGSFGANMLDYVVPGKAPVSTAYDSMLRRQFGNQLQAHPSVTAQADAARAFRPGTPAKTVAAAAPAPGPAAPDVVQPPAPTLRSEFLAPGTAANRAARAQMDSGMAYVPGNGQGMVRSSSGGIVKLNTSDDRYAPLSDKTLRRMYAPAENASVNKWIADQDQSARDTHAMSTSASSGPGFVDELRAARAQNRQAKLDADRNHNELQARVTMRGQDLQNGASMFSTEQGAANARYQALKDQRDYEAGRYDKGLEQSAKMDDQGRAAFKNKFDTLDKDGKPIARPDMEAAANELVMRQNPNWSQLSPPERAQLQSDAFDHISLVGNLRDHQNNSIWQTLGLKNPDVRADRMPDLKGAKLEETGFLEGKLTPNASSGDYKLTTKDGKTMFLGRDKVTEDQLSYLKRMGVTLGSK